MITVFIAYLSEYLVDAIRGAASDLAVPELFLGTIVIPIVGNAAEHAAAIIFAAKNKMELSMGIAVGSATQIALFVLPLCAPRETTQACRRQYPRTRTRTTHAHTHVPPTAAHRVRAQASSSAGGWTPRSR